ncbi:MAG: pyruvate formate lyase family protein, partial [Clostridia bacterium]|nr:pyruvate formate lyase family protein [Clostridia bacterium]
MDIKKAEPFAWGYVHSEKKDVESRIANGIKVFAEKIPLDLDISCMFVAPVWKMGGLAVHYDRAGGIELRSEVRDRLISENPDDVEQINYYYDFMRPYETSRVISKFRTPVQEKLEINKCCWAAGGGHSNPDYEMFLRIGTEGIREKIRLFRGIHNDRDDFYDALETTLTAFETIADRYQALAKEKLPDAVGEDKTILQRLIDAFDNIPRKSPRNFFEACQMFWLGFAFLDIDSPGLFDYALGKYYEDDDPDDRYRCLENLWELFHKTRTWNLCVGRSDEFGNYHCCALTYDILKLAREKKYDTPNLTMRVNENTPEDLWKSAALTLSTGIGMPAIYNDNCVCAALEAIGIPASDAHLYCMNGCNQIDIFGKSHMGLEDGEISVAKALEFALFNGECRFSGEKLGLETGDASKFETFDEMLCAYKKQIEYMADYITSRSNKAQELFALYAPNPWKSLIEQGCIEKGLDYKNRGPYYGHAQVLTEGLPDAADSLTAVK